MFLYSDNPLDSDGVTGHYLMVIEVWDRLSVSKRAEQKSDIKRFELNKIKSIEIKETC
jgi:hypothetical protein